MPLQAQLERLKQAIATGRCAVVAGTGLSVAACQNQNIEGRRVATWSGLLEHGVDYCRAIGAADDVDVQVLSGQIATGRVNFLISAAEDISQRMRSRGPGLFLGWLKDSVGKLELRDRAVIDALARLPGVLATLSYDGLLEQATGRRAVTWRQPDEVQETLQGGGAHAVLHLHGWFGDPDSVVLGLASYLAVKDDAHARAVLQLFTLDRTLLFVGCGGTLLDPNFNQLIEWGKVALKDVAPRHILLCRKSELAGLQQQLAAASWLQPLEYGEEYEDLAPFLRSLAPSIDAALPMTLSRSAAARLELSAYRQAMRKRYGRLKLEELDPTSHDIQPLTLTGIFIPQSSREFVEFTPGVLELPKELKTAAQFCGARERRTR